MQARKHMRKLMYKSGMHLTWTIHSHGGLQERGAEDKRNKHKTCKEELHVSALLRKCRKKIFVWNWKELCVCEVVKTCRGIVVFIVKKKKKKSRGGRWNVLGKCTLVSKINKQDINLWITLCQAVLLLEYEYIWSLIPMKDQSDARNYWLVKRNS